LCGVQSREDESATSVALWLSGDGASAPNDGVDASSACRDTDVAANDSSASDPRGGKSSERNVLDDANALGRAGRAGEMRLSPTSWGEKGEYGPGLTGARSGDIGGVRSGSVGSSALGVTASSASREGCLAMVDASSRTRVYVDAPGVLGAEANESPSRVDASDARDGLDCIAAQASGEVESSGRTKVELELARAIWLLSRLSCEFLRSLCCLG